jgi:hypothetical protein
MIDSPFDERLMESGYPRWSIPLLARTRFRQAAAAAAHFLTVSQVRVVTSASLPGFGPKSRSRRLASNWRAEAPQFHL